jgi:DNA-binding transcriptional MerR regulator
VRYYEEIGLLPPASRRHGGQRSYDEEDVGRLIFIRRCRDFGFSIEQVRVLATLIQDRERSCLEARDLGLAHLEAVRAKLDELNALERAIAGFVESCDSACAGGPGPDCVALSDLHQPAASRPAGEGVRRKSARRAASK